MSYTKEQKKELLIESAKLAFQVVRLVVVCIGIVLLVRGSCEKGV